MMAEKTNIERLRQAWENAPSGAKNTLYEMFGYTKQNVADILENGRKSDKIVVTLLEDFKKASAAVNEIVSQQNEIVQEV